jgi:cell division GTPase FtsZ
MPRRKRGAQPGNLNALKHGFYSRNFKDLENADLEAMIAEDLDSEIAMLRVVVRRAFELSTAPAEDNEDAGQQLDKAIHIMNAMGMASIRLGSLLKIQAMLGKREGDIGATISEALKQVARDLNL